MSDLHIVSYGEFNEKVKGASVPVLVDFYADWCGPCKMLAPVIEEIADSAEGFNVYKVNVDELSDLAVEYGVSSIPTVAAFKNGREINRITGLTDKSAIIDLIKN